MMTRMRATVALLCACAVMTAAGRIEPSLRDRAIHIDSRMSAPRCATLELQLLAQNVPA